MKFDLDIAPQSLGPLAVFLSVCVLGISLLPLLQLVESKMASTGRVLGQAASAYEQLLQAQSAIERSDFQAADDSLGLAYAGFSKALSEMRELENLALDVAGFAEGKKLLVAASESALALQYVTSAIRNVSGLRLGSDGFYAETGGEPKESLVLALSNLNIGLDYLNQAVLALKNIDADKLPVEFTVKVVSAQAKLSSVARASNGFQKLARLISGFLSEEERTYLLLFQNNRELRATGGFIGTYGILNLQAGKIASLKIESVYNPDGQLKAAIAPPEPLTAYLTGTWGMRDSNWFFNFPDSAKKALAFLKLSTGIEADEVIAFTPEIFVRLLALTGPIAMPEYGVELSSENFMDTVQYHTSEAYDRELNQPKKFLADFTPRLLAELSRLSAESWLAALNESILALSRKDLQFYSADAARQSILSEMGWTGAVRQSPADYLAVVHSSVGGGKTSQSIASKIDLTSWVLPGGRVRNTLVIERIHGQNQEKEFPVNRDYMRIYVPAESRLVSASGFDDPPQPVFSSVGLVSDPDVARVDFSSTIYPAFRVSAAAESGKTVFSGWLELAPSTERAVTIVYDLPFTYDLSSPSPQAYSLLVQKQAGALPVSVVSRFELPSGSAVHWTSTNLAVPEGGSYRFEDSLATDTSWGIIFSQATL